MPLFSRRMLMVGLAFVVSGVITQLWASAAATSPPADALPLLSPRTVEQPPSQLTLPPPTPIHAPFTDQACLECHTDQERLTLLAHPDEPAHEALSSGPG